MNSSAFGRLQTSRDARFSTQSGLQVAVDCRSNWSVFLTLRYMPSVAPMAGQVLEMDCSAAGLDTRVHVGRIRGMADESVRGVSIFGA